MSEQEQATTFENKCDILGDLWMQYRFEKQFEDFIAYNDIGLPMGFMVSEDLVKPTELAKSMIEETFELLLISLKVKDEGFECLEDVFLAAPE